MNNLLVIGEILVEIMADSLGDGFDGPQPLTGPFPSGAPAIFADQVAKIGQPVSIISCVGNDDFGQLNLDRLQADGVDISGVHIDTDRPTGSAFVRYQEDGSRDFVFNIKHSACGFLHLTDDAQKTIERANHLHVMGSSLSSPEFVELNLKVAQDLKARGGTVSLDPNLRKEMLAAPGLKDAMLTFITLTDLFLPSGEELTLLTDAEEEQAAINELFAKGIKAIVHKNGSDGARYIDGRNEIHAPAFSVTEIDPTGAGDCFGGAFTALWLQGIQAEEALVLAAAAGALAVTKRGPMEGTSDLTTIQQFVGSQT